MYDSSERGFPPWDELRDAWRYRYAITQFIRRNIVARYKRSTLGVAWTMLNPLGMMLVRVIVFSTIFGRDPGYPVYVLSGLMVFNFFSDVTNGTIKNLVWGGGGLLKRIYIPRSVFSISSVGSAFVKSLDYDYSTVFGYVYRRITHNRKCFIFAYRRDPIDCLFHGYGINTINYLSILP